MAFEELEMPVQAMEMSPVQQQQEGEQQGQSQRQLVQQQLQLQRQHLSYLRQQRQEQQQMEEDDIDRPISLTKAMLKIISCLFVTLFVLLGFGYAAADLSQSNPKMPVRKRFLDWPLYYQHDTTDVSIQANNATSSSSGSSPCGPGLTLIVALLLVLFM